MTEGANISGRGSPRQILGANKQLVDKVKALYGDDSKKILEILYGCLNVLDSKAAAQITVNGVFIAVIALIISKNQAQLFLYIGVAILLLISCGFSFFITRVSWPFYGYIKLTNDKPDCGEEIERLAHQVNVRRWCFKFAWYFSAGALAILTYLFVVY